MPDSAKTDFRILFEKAPGLYLVMDPQFFILAVSDDFLRATFKRREDIVGQHFFDVFPENGNEATATCVRNLRSSLERVVRDRVADPMAVQKHEIRRPSGMIDERYWSCVNTPILGPDSRVQYIIHSVEDVTEFVRLKKSGEEQGKLAHLREQLASMETEILTRSEQLGVANQQLKVAYEELGMRTAELQNSLQTMETFTYTIAHDLRAPLRALVHFSTLVAQEYVTRLDEEGKDALDRIKNAALRMDRLIRDLLKYGQLTHVDVTIVPISLESVVRKVLEDFDADIRVRNAEVEVRGPLPTVMGNATLLELVLMHLIDNALKFVPEEKTPRVVIETKLSANRVRLCIVDNGLGIPPIYHEKIFDLFARLHKPTQYSGTGIGLALVKKAMERMMGHVGLDSVAGEGSCFWLDFRAGR